MTRAAVSGALGRMGTLARQTIEAAPDLQYAGGFARTRDPAQRLYNDLEQLFLEERPEVLVDFTARPFTQTAAESALAHGARPIIGSSEWNESERADLALRCRERALGALIVPNFAIGAVLMMRFAQEAARHFPTAEIVEMHRAKKRDKPSATAAATAARIASGGGAHAVPIHSVRLEGLLAHQMVLFGNTGELLTIRHDSFSRDSFAAGLLRALRGVGALDGLHVGLEAVL
ncbi:MAG: 4-hydroxy-tetrahydrodipicolinate reductase [Candidatus Baltobacteraceae bacterium]